MRLTSYTDFSLRALMYLAVCPGGMASAAEISDAFGISRHHLTKVIHRLARLGVVKTTPGRGGGVALAKPADQIRIGEIVRLCEPSLAIVECFDPVTNTCPITPMCRVADVMKNALDAFLGSLDQHTIADVVSKRETELQQLLRLPASH